jgi:hypothetical protein
MNESGEKESVAGPHIVVFSLYGEALTYVVIDNRRYRTLSGNSG